jgi:hypothetical protein
MMENKSTAELVEIINEQPWLEIACASRQLAAILANDAEQKQQIAHAEDVFQSSVKFAEEQAQRIEELEKELATTAEAFRASMDLEELRYRQLEFANDKIAKLTKENNGQFSEPELIATYVKLVTNLEQQIADLTKRAEIAELALSLDADDWIFDRDEDGDLINYFLEGENILQLETSDDYINAIYAIAEHLIEEGKDDV